MKRVVFVADTHCGHRGGLIPKEWQWNISGEPERRAWAKLQRKSWDYFLRLVDEIGRPDVLVAVGDLIDGSGEKSSGTELISADIYEQCKMAITCLKIWEAKKLVVVRGTPYHVSGNADYEDVIATALNADIRDHAQIKVEGVLFDVCHHINVSRDIRSKASLITRERIENLLRWERNEFSKADVIVRGHIHSFIRVEGTNWEALTLPGLQTTTKVGNRRFRGQCDWGVVYYDVDGGDWTCRKRICQVRPEIEPMIVVS